MKYCYLFVVVALSGLMPSLGYGQLPAFSGAEGPGSTASGGRAGDVYHVTNLEFDVNGVIPGSLKYGINTAPNEGRIIVFDVGGTIYKNGGGSNAWFRSGKSNVTIAGQTAPGGITIAGVGSKFTGDNIVVRNLTIRPNKDPVNPTSFTYDGLATQATNSIIDHVTVTWYTDEGISATDAVNNTTVQYSLIGEGLNYNGHSYGSIINTQNSNAPLAYHHNLYAQNNSRMPRLGSETGTGAVTNFYNNVIYNWQSRAGYSALNADSGVQEPSRTNFINNFYARGANNGSTIFQSAGDQTQIYQSGNLYDGVRDADFNDAVAVTWSNFSGTETQLATPLGVAAGVIDSATVGRDRTLSYGGALWWDRHAIDQRIIDSVYAGTGALINDVPVNEWNDVLAAPMTTRPSGWDTDNDGMPDDWEVAHGLDSNQIDFADDFDSDGYINLEEYLNEIAEWPAPQPVVFNGATNSRYAQITNWDIKWQPSKYDSAVINTGTVVVDAVGQHAGNLILGMNPGGNATVNITGGWLKVEDAAYGLSDGIVSVGDNPAATAVLNLSGGKLTTKTLLKGVGGTFNFNGGVLSAESVGFTLVNNGGTIAPGNSPGLTHIMGDLTMNSGSIEIEIAGNGTSDYDAVWVDGTLEAGGSLNVLLDGYTPVEGDVFEILSFGLANGGFDLNLPALANGLAWDSSELLVSGALSVVAEVAQDGDFDGDGDVDGRDFLMWQRGETSDPHSPTELEQWQNGYNAGQLAASTAVPEPCSLLLVMGLLIGRLFNRGGAANGR